MASPLSTLRRYQFGFFVFFGVVCMLVFVIGDPLDTWLKSRGGGSRRAENKVVVTWRGGELRENEIGYTQSVRNVIREFIRTLLEETQKQKGQPRVQMLSLSPSEEDIVYTHLLAQRAEAMGMVVSDETALIYLEQLTATLIPRNGIGSIFKDTVGGRISEQQLLGEIKSELLAQNYLSLTYPDLTQGQLPVQAWEYHRRLNRRIKAEVLPVNVADFNNKVTKQPTEAEVQALYSAAKDRYPDPASPEPGFKRHRKAAFEFVRADRKKFEEEETAKLKPQVTDQEIQEYYDKNKNEFRIPEVSPEQPKPESTHPDATKPDAIKPDAIKPDSEKSPAPAAPPAGDKQPDKAQPPSDAAKPEVKPTEKKAESKAEPQPPAEKPAADKVEEKKQEPAEQTKPKAAEPGADCGDDQDTNKAAAKADGQTPAAATEKQKEPAAAPATPPGEKKAEEAPVAADKKATSESKEKAKEEAKPSPPAAVPAPAAVTPVPGKPDPVPPVAPATAPLAPLKPEPKYKPFDDKLKEEIREKIAKQKAAQAAQQRIDKGFDEFKRAVEKYARERRSAELTGKSAPQPLDLAKLAESHGMTAGNLPLADPNKIQESELGKTRGFDFSSMTFEPIPFHVLAYRDGILLWKPDQIRGSTADGNPDAEFLYWKSKEENPFVPELKDVRAEVVEAWKLREALTLAEAEAKSLADKTRQSAKPLKEVFADNKERKVEETNQFTWMTRGFLPANMGGAPSLSSVDHVEFAGQEFMRSVFQLQIGEVGTAVNQPRTVVYVVRIETESPTDDALRDQFLQSGSSTELRQVARFDRMEVQRSWFEALRREMNLKWERTPQS